MHGIEKIDQNFIICLVKAAKQNESSQNKKDATSIILNGYTFCKYLPNSVEEVSASTLDNQATYFLSVPPLKAKNPKSEIQ